MNTPVFVIYLVLLVLGAIPALTFPIYYSVRVKWWRLARGPERETAGHLVMFSALFGLLYVRGAINVSTGPGREAIFSQSPGNVAFMLFIAVLAMFVGWHRVWLFHKGRKERRRTQMQEPGGS